MALNLGQGLQQRSVQLGMPSCVCPGGTQSATPHFTTPYLTTPHFRHSLAEERGSLLDPYLCVVGRERWG